MEPDIASIERRERHLWIVTLFLLALFAGVTILTYALLMDSAAFEGRPSNGLATALIGLLVLIALFCAYALHTHNSFSSMRLLYQKQAQRDLLTGLLNRQSFEVRFEVEVAKARRDDRPLAIMLCDLDLFKEINDAHGHQFGDEVLKLVSTSILDATRGSDLVFRWGGDEFLALAAVATREGAMIAARRIRASVQRLAESRELNLDLSIGIAFYPEHAREAGKLIRLADKALYIAKKSGDKIHVGEESYELSEKSVNMVFQPVFEVGTGVLTGYEALSRDPTGRSSITRVFQRYSAVGQLGELKRIIFQHQVRVAGERALSRVFINIDFETLQTVEPFPKPAGVEIVLEISEAESLYDVERHLSTAEAWRRQGYKFAIDDFGAGFMSLPFIARLVPNYIKVDRSTIVEATGSKQFSRFLKDLVQAMRNYSEDGIIGEGVETQEEYDVVQEMGVDQVQGFLTGRPAKLD